MSRNWTHLLGDRFSDCRKLTYRMVNIDWGICVLYRGDPTTTCASWPQSNYSPSGSLGTMSGHTIEWTIVDTKLLEDFTVLLNKHCSLLFCIFGESISYVCMLFLYFQSFLNYYALFWNIMQYTVYKWSSMIFSEHTDILNSLSIFASPTFHNFFDVTIMGKHSIVFSFNFPV